MSWIGFLTARALLETEDFPAFGEVGFMKNAFWRQSLEFSTLKRKNSGSHPGIGTGGGFIAFGTTSLQGMDGKPDSQLLVDREDCPVLRELTLFLLKSRIPAIPWLLDSTVKEPERVSSRIQVILRSKLQRLAQGSSDGGKERPE